MTEIIPKSFFGDVSSLELIAFMIEFESVTVKFVHSDALILSAL